MRERNSFKFSAFCGLILILISTVASYALMFGVVDFGSAAANFALSTLIASTFASLYLLAYGINVQQKNHQSLNSELESLLLTKVSLDTASSSSEPLAMLLTCIRERLVAGDDAIAQARLLESRFKRTVSEDIKSPLLDIMAGIKSLRAANQSAADLAILESIHGAAFRLLGSLDDVVEISRQEGKQIEANEVSSGLLSPRQLADDLSEIYAAAVSKKEEVILSVLVDPRSPAELKSSPKRILHLLGNLIENSLRYTEKGEIYLEMRCLSEERSGSNCSYQFICSDSGIGISAARLERINHELNNKVDDSEYQELGLGMRAALKIVRELNGSIRVNSLKGEHTEVIVTLSLPVARWGGADQKQIPSFFIHSASREAFMTLAKIAFFHKVRPILIDDVRTYSGSLPLIIDAKALMKQEGKCIIEIGCKEKCVVLISHGQFKWRPELVKMGFTRFLSLPLTSTSLLRALLDKEIDKPSQAKSNLRLDNLRVLVVDDVPTARIAVTDYLTSRGAKVVEADDGIELIHQVTTSSEPYDLILCDLTMAHLGGVEAVARVRKLPNASTKNTKIVAVTAYQINENEFLRNHSDFDAALNKPLNFDTLSLIIDRFFTQRLVTKSSAPTKVIDLEELLARTAGKASIAARVLDSFIVSSQQELQELFSERRKGDVVLLAKSLHTLKGLLLEVGAKGPAERMQTFEEQIQNDPTSLDGKWTEISGLLAHACEEATALKDSLTKESKELAFLVRDSLPSFKPN